MSDPLKEMFGDSNMTPKQEKKFFERIAKEENEILKALESKKKLKGTPDKKDNIGMKTGGIINKKVGGGNLTPKQQKIAKLAGNPDEIDAADFATLRNKKYGGKITYKMTGGQVVDSSYD